MSFLFNMKLVLNTRSFIYVLQQGKVLPVTKYAV